MNFTDARQAMVESQLMPNGISDEQILKAFSEIPREPFLPEGYQYTCYKDEDIILPNKRSIIAPLTLAKLIKSSSIGKDDVVLCIGDVSGYSSAVIAQLASTVIRVESDPAAIAFSEEVFQTLDIMNIVSIEGRLSEGDKQHAPFDRIILCGASAETPQHLIRQTSEEGALIYVQKESSLSVGNIVKIINNPTKNHSFIKGENVQAPYCLGYEPQKEFVF